jgi:ATP synthase F1 gamma subunit
MSSLTELQENLESLETAQFVTTVLRDISANRLQAIRAAFEKNSAFYKEMRDLDILVQTYALKKHPERMKKRSERKDSTVFAALTSNKRFFGTLNRDVMSRFIDRLKNDREIKGIVIGQTGKTIIEGTEYASRCTFVEFEDDTPTSEEVLSLIKSLSEYTKVYMLYPTFINPFRQEVGLIDITHKPAVSTVSNITVDYIFEPDVDKLLEFFETQVRFILFNRVVLDTRLAQIGARLTKMQHAREEAKQRVREMRREIHKEVLTIQSMRLLETFAGFHKRHL